MCNGKERWELVPELKYAEIKKEREKGWQREINRPRWSGTRTWAAPDSFIMVFCSCGLFPQSSLCQAKPFFPVVCGVTVPSHAYYGQGGKGNFPFLVRRMG